MINYNSKLAKSTIRFLVSHLKYITKFSVENYTEKSFIYVNTKKCIFNISVSEKIVVEIDNNQDRYNSHFYNETYRYDSVDEFRVLFNDIVLRATKKENKELIVKYKGKNYPIYIELSHIDYDRGMGVEKLYDLNIYDGKGNEQFVAQVSEYPTGFFSLVHIFEGFDIEESNIINYFHEKY